MHALARTAGCPSRLARDGPLWDHVERLPREGYVPEQVAGMLRRMHPDKPTLQVSDETIYTALCAMPRGDLTMANVVVFTPGGYRYISAVFQYSGGVAAEAGFEIERARLARPLPIADGFAAVEARLKAIGRPSTAFAACELRSPAPFTEQGFIDFNRRYVQTLERWGIYSNEVNPVARTNVCPEYDKPASPSLYAFSYTVPTESKRGSFIVAGSGEAQEGKGPYSERIVRAGETSSDAMREKMRFVMTEMERRLKALGFGWQDAVSTQVYTVRDIGALVGGEIVKKGAAPGGVTWTYCRPPVAGLEYEMDVRGAAREIVLAP